MSQCLVTIAVFVNLLSAQQSVPFPLFSFLRESFDRITLWFRLACSRTFRVGPQISSYLSWASYECPSVVSVGLTYVWPVLKNFHTRLLSVGASPDGRLISFLVANDTSPQGSLLPCITSKGPVALLGATGPKCSVVLSTLAPPSHGHCFYLVFTLWLTEEETRWTALHKGGARW